MNEEQIKKPEDVEKEHKEPDYFTKVKDDATDVSGNGQRGTRWAGREWSGARDR